MVCVSELARLPTGTRALAVWLFPDTPAYPSSRFLGCSSSIPRSTAFGRIDDADLTEPSDGAGDDSLGGVMAVCARAMENRVARWEKNEPMPAPQVDAAGIVSAGGGGGGGIFEPIRLSGRMPAGGGCGDDSGEENMLSESRPDRMLPVSDLETLTMLLDALPA